MKHLQMSTCVIIHGTWGAKSDFAFAESQFCRGIGAAVRTPMTFERFQWSGANSFIDRAEASQRLRDFVLQLPQHRLPVYLVAHSHGGNVASLALRDDIFAARVGGLVTLGTPYLGCHERHWLQLLEGASGHIFLYCAFMGLALLGIFGAIGGAISLIHPIFSVLGVALLVGIFFVAARSRDENVFAGFVQHLRERASEVVANHHVAFVQTKVLVINSRADEALWWLQKVTSATHLPFLVLHISIRAVWWLACIAFLSMFIALVMLKVLEMEDGAGFILPSFVTLGLGVITTMLAITFAIVVKLVYTLLGGGTSTTNWAEIVTQTTVSRSPQFECFDLEELEAPVAAVHGGLWHSKYMRSSAVIDHIARKLDCWRS